MTFGSLLYMQSHCFKQTGQGTAGGLYTIVGAAGAPLKEKENMEMNEKLDRLDSLYASRNLQEAEKELLSWISEAETRGNPGEQLTLYNELEGLYRVTGRAPEASEVSKKALKLIETMGLSGTVHHATTLLNAATAHRAAGFLSEALSLYRQAQNVYESLKNEPNILYYMAALSNNVAQVYQELGQYDDAEPHLLKALSIIKTVPGAESEESTTHTNLSLLYYKMGKLSEAACEIEKALIYYRTPEGAKDNHLSSALSAAGTIAAGLGNTQKAREYFAGALEVSERVFGDTPETRMIRKNLESLDQI